MKILWMVFVFFMVIQAMGFSTPEKEFVEARESMIEIQLKARGISDPKVLEAVRKVERHLFVPPHLTTLAYQDSPLPIGLDQTISQPYIVAYMTEALKLQPADKVLEIGTGSGYQAAILAEIAGEVYSIELLPELTQMAAARLQELGYKNVQVKQGDGYQGWPEKAPFDAIILTAAPEEIPQKLLEQLKTGGRMILPLGKTDQELILLTKTNQGFKQEKLFPVRFVPMVKDKSK